MNEAQPVNPAREDIAALLSAINTAWTTANTEALDAFFHEDMVIAGPDATKIGQGREACVRSYRDFIDSAHVASFTVGEPTIDIWGNTAQAFYEFEIVYRMHDKEYHEVGRDVFTFNRNSPEAPWLAVWRMLIPIDAHSANTHNA